MPRIIFCRGVFSILNEVVAAKLLDLDVGSSK